MKRNRTRHSFVNPFVIWADLALKTGEMMLASAQVIGHRMGRMAAAGPKPNAHDRREFTLMGQEKIEAAAESVQAMTAQMMRTGPQLGVKAVQQMLSGAMALTTLATSRTPGQSMARQAKLVRTMTESAAMGSQLTGSVARLAQRGLKPISSRATANAKRLGKR